MPKLNPQSAMVLFSGGQDSTTCLAWALHRFAHVETVGFDYGQRHEVEMVARQGVLGEIVAIDGDWPGRLGEDHVVDLRVIGQISETALTHDVAIAVADNGLPTTFVPGRNILFLTAAAALAYRRGVKRLVGGFCETDFSGYPDCRDDTIKGAPFGKNLVQWSKGEYDGATNLQDDLLFIGAYVPDRPDIHADNLASATEFTECSSTLAGIIGEPTDVDVFTFTTNAGNVTMDAFPTNPGPNLDIQMTLFDGAGVEMFALNLPVDIWAAITFPLAAGQYYLEIDGVGLSGEYTHYGSLGQYTLTVEVPARP